MKKVLLIEGPVGHMAHPYENLSLTFSKLKEMFEMIVSGFPDVEVTEKLDGQNIILTYDHESGKSLAIRRMAEHSAMGGIDKEAIYKFFTQDKIEKSYRTLLNKGLSKEEARRRSSGAAITHVAEAFHDAMDAFEKAARSMPKEFFTNKDGCKIFYNAEVVDPRSRNIVDYDTQDLVLHRTLHSKLCPESNRLESMDNEEAKIYSKYIENYLEMMQTESEISGVKVNALRDFDNLVIDDELLSRSTHEIDSLTASSNLSDSSTIKDYLKKVIDKTIATKIPNISDEVVPLVSEAVFYFITNKTVPRIRNEINPILDLVGDENSKSIIKDFLRNRAALAELVREAIKPIEYIVHNFAAGYLKAVKSLYILNHEEVTGNLKKKVGDQVTNIQSNEIQSDLMVLHRNIGKMINHNTSADVEDVLSDESILQIYDKINTAVEGLVFTFDGQEYKITGQFAPINQIMGLGRFSRGDGKRDDVLSELPSPATYENLLRENEIKDTTSEKIAIFSGGFKPPHVGHFLASQYLAEKSEATKLYILVGSSIRQSKDKNVSIGPEESEYVWSSYYHNAPNINYEVVIIKISGSPIRWVYDKVQNGDFASDEIFCGIGACVGNECEPEDRRWEQLTQKFENTNQVIIPMQGGSIRGSIMRELLAAEDDRFFNYLPDHLNNNQKIEIRNKLIAKDYLK